MSLAQIAGPSNQRLESDGPDVEGLLNELSKLQDARSTVILKIDELIDARSFIDSKITSTVALLTAHGAKASVTIECADGEVIRLESSLPKPKDFAVIASNYVRDNDRPLFEQGDRNGRTS